ncbi:MAG: ATP-binding protein [Gemmatimonadaceae bacterium]
MAPRPSEAVPHPPDLFDRAAAWRDLSTLWRSRRPELAFVIGRRRVGKSYLLSRFARAVGGIYYQATRRTEAEQLAMLSRIAGEHFEDPALQQGVSFPNWEALFGYLTGHVGDDPFLLILDEFPYLASAAPALPSIIQTIWDHDWPARRMKLVLSGSHITAMRRLEAADQPLYGRRTARLQIAPFPYTYVADFAPNYTPVDQTLAYGIFGGLPGHLALLDGAASLAENVARWILDPSGRLFDEAQHMLDAFLGEADIHYSIIEAIATGEQTWNNITKRLGKDGGSVSRPMRWLEEMQIVSRVVPLTESVPHKSKRAIYRIADPYVAFWHRFVAPLIASGTAGVVAPDRLWRRYILPRLDGHTGPVFEEMCRAFVRRASGLPFAPVRVGTWWDAASQNEIDVVALGEDGEMLVGECKWGAFNAHDLKTLRDRAALLARELPAGRGVTYALFSTRGLAGAAIKAEAAAGRVLHFTLDDLFRPERSAEA